MADALAIRAAAPADAGGVAAIYNHYVLKTIVTFEENPVGDEEMARRLATASDLHPWLVAEAGGAIAGYAYARKYHERPAYRHTVELAAYLDPRQVGAGLGTALYAALFDTLIPGKVHAVIGSIAMPNPASVRLHEKFGFRQAADFPQLGFKFGQWIDVTCFHRLLGRQ